MRQTPCSVCEIRATRILIHMVIHVTSGTLSLVVGSPPHRKTTRLYEGDRIQVDVGQDVEIIADAPSVAEFRPGAIDETTTARPRKFSAVDPDVSPQASS